MPEHNAINRILEPGGLTPLYQPIVAYQEGTSSLIGFECLMRGPRGTNFEAANVLFEYVRLKREETLVDRACVSAALAHAPVRPGLTLTINVHASTLGRDQAFPEFVVATARARSIQPEWLTVEIVEHAPPWGSLSFAAALRSLRAAGVRVALDDVGLGQSNFKMMIDARPDYLKLDRYFVEGCQSDSSRRAVIESVGTLAAHFGAQVIAEGVETHEVAETLTTLGVRLMQGFFFARPLTAEAAASFGQLQTA